MQSGQLGECTAFIECFAREISKNQKLPARIQQNVVHAACDTLHRYLVSAGASEEWRLQDSDFYLLALASFFIAAKLNSIHYGGADALLSFYVRERPGKHSKVKSETLSLAVRRRLEKELARVEFDILKTINFQFTPAEQLPLALLRRFVLGLQHHFAQSQIPPRVVD